MYLVDANVCPRPAAAAARLGLGCALSIRAPFIHHARRDHEGNCAQTAHDALTAARLTAWLEQPRQNHSDRILPISDRIALEWGRLAAERPRGVVDGLIAATVAVHGKIIVTRNVTDFADTRVPLINPWDQ